MRKPGMWLVLYDSTDEAALWAVEGLKARGLESEADQGQKTAAGRLADRHPSNEEAFYESVH
jgi:hypothetical protein